MRKVKISAGRFALTVELHDTPTADAVFAAAPFQSRVSVWPGEVYFQAPFRVAREDDARVVIERGEIAFRPDGDAIIIGYGPTPCSEGDEIRLASRANVWGRTADDVGALSEIEAGEMVRLDPVSEP